jgi:hypothetical protein
MLLGPAWVQRNPALTGATRRQQIACVERRLPPSATAMRKISRQWLEKLSLHKHHNIALIALANKLARMAWAVLATGQVYQPHVLADVGSAELASR